MKGANPDAEQDNAHQIIALAASYADEDGHAVLYSQLHRLDGMVTQLETELLAAQEREKALREVAHQIVGFSRTVQGDHPTVREIAKNANAALAGSPSEKPGNEEESHFGPGDDAYLEQADAD